MNKANNTASQIVQTSFPYSFLELFQKSINKYPDRIALRFKETELTYKEVDSRISYLAASLSSRGIGKSSLVAISVERSFELVFSMLAVLKLGAIFLPVDPNYPKERRLFMLNDARPDALITTRALSSEALSLESSIEKIFVDSEFTGFNSELESTYQSNWIDLSGQLDVPAYIIYTSGTTGRPKGAINTHQGLANLALAQIEGFFVDHESRVLQFASFSFDASISEIVMALGTGATLVMAPQADLYPGPSLVNLLIDEKISHVTLPPSVLAILPELPFLDLKVIVVAGEACPLELARSWSKNRKFINAYGVSEAAVCSAMKEFDPALNSLPIGRAMLGTDFKILNEEKTPVNIGDIGELYIGGVGVGLGYLNRQELSNEKFVILKSYDGRLSRYYRSGDLVRALLDGSLEYIGRSDNQVKVRGFRIELDEIANTIQEYDAIQQSAVVVRSDSNGDKQIIAYLRLNPNLQLDLAKPENSEAIKNTIRDLRTFLAKKLPSFMVPSFLIPISDFPLSPSGKVDLKNLRERKIELGYEGGMMQRARTETELKLASLCRQLMDIEDVPMEHSFLNIGGDSLKAAELAWRIGETFKVSVMETDILGAASLCELGQLLDSRDQSTLPELEVVERQGFFEPTPSQEIFGVLEKLSVDTSPLNCFAAFEISGAVDQQSLSLAYKDIFERHESLRLKFAFVDELFRMSAHDKVDVNLEFIDYSQLADAESHLAQFFVQAEKISFNMRSDVLLRCFLIRLSAQKSIFVLVAHHAVFDAWSLRIFMQDLLALAAERISGKCFLEPLRVQYLDYVVWLRKLLKLRDLENDKKYLSNVFAKPLSLFELKGVKPRPAIKSRQGANLFLRFSSEETAQLGLFSEKMQLTPFMTCSAILKLAFYLSSGKADITIGGPVSIRYHRELERQIGLYGSAYILRTVISESESMTDYFYRIRSGLLDSYRHQVFSIGDLFAEYNLEMDLSRTPPYDISVASTMFDLKLVDSEVAKHLGIDIRPYQFPLTTSFFDFEITFNLFAGELELEVRYDSALYSEQQIQKLLSDYKRLMQIAVEGRSLLVGEALKIIEG